MHWLAKKAVQKDGSNRENPDIFSPEILAFARIRPVRRKREGEFKKQANRKLIFLTNISIPDFRRMCLPICKRSVKFS